MTEHTALYVYALLPDRPDAADGVTGIDGRPLRLVRVPGTSVAALVHDAAPTPLEGGDDQVRRWVEEQSRAVDTVWERTGSVLPMTFNVLVAAEPSPGDGDAAGPAAGRSAEQRLVEWVTEQAADIGGQLENLAGRCELRVDITVDRTAATAGGAGEDAPEGGPDGLSPGMRRLMAKQREHRARATAGQLADTLHAETRQRLLAVAEDYRDRGPTHRVAGETDVLCAALLVRREDIDAVGTVLTELRARQPAVRVRFLGPWPPYSFIDTAHRARAEEMAP
ncbi:GvpL/GvpF family gas vesicle protein [Streptomyces prasinopilosus]|uniref:Gas vesicle synthesis protein GvpL/GvpF n=1 Tax=Streptomyces prasinopilosus TaxID=67344 RepID=A0A1G6NI30_9ACTN|nr:GvpL/GvpF family gas vesicle protein [Streptomyces prasinopilosus]SDC67054.1 Gas vesicle synthesis protein GvpL/GvpF [Streptomyces prasinopilosus]